MKHRCEHYAGVCNRLVCDKEGQPSIAESNARQSQCGACEAKVPAHDLYCSACMAKWEARHG